MARAGPRGCATTWCGAMVAAPSRDAATMGAQLACCTQQRRGRRERTPAASSSRAPCQVPSTPIPLETAWKYQSMGAGTCSTASKKASFSPARRAGLKNPPSEATSSLRAARAASNASTKLAPSST